MTSTRQQQASEQHPIPGSREIESHIEPSDLQLVARKEPSTQGLFDGRSGEPLKPAARAEMEDRFHHDFSDVRIYADETVANSAALLGAKAATSGNRIAFGADRFNPGCSTGRELLAHELTHVVQQSRPGAAASSDALETEARTLGASGGGIVTQSAPAGALQLDPQKEKARRKKELARRKKGAIEPHITVKELSSNTHAAVVQGVWHYKIIRTRSKRPLKLKGKPLQGPYQLHDGPDPHGRIDVGLAWPAAIYYDNAQSDLEVVNGTKEHIKGVHNTAFPNALITINVVGTAKSEEEEPAPAKKKTTAPKPAYWDGDSALQLVTKLEEIGSRLSTVKPELLNDPLYAKLVQEDLEKYDKLKTYLQQHLPPHLKKKGLKHNDFIQSVKKWAKKRGGTRVKPDEAGVDPEAVRARAVREFLEKLEKLTSGGIGSALFGAAKMAGAEDETAWWFFEGGQAFEGLGGAAAGVKARRATKKSLKDPPPSKRPPYYRSPPPRVSPPPSHVRTQPPTPPKRQSIPVPAIMGKQRAANDTTPPPPPSTTAARPPVRNIRVPQSMANVPPSNQNAPQPPQRQKQVMGAGRSFSRPKQPGKMSPKVDPKGRGRKGTAIKKKSPMEEAREALRQKTDNLIEAQRTENATRNKLAQQEAKGASDIDLQITRNMLSGNEQATKMAKEHRQESFDRLVQLKTAKDRAQLDKVSKEIETVRSTISELRDDADSTQRHVGNLQQKLNNFRGTKEARQKLQEKLVTAKKAAKAARETYLEQLKKLNEREHILRGKRIDISERISESTREAEREAVGFTRKSFNTLKDTIRAEARDKMGTPPVGKKGEVFDRPMTDPQVEHLFSVHEAVLVGRRLGLDDTQIQAAVNIKVNLRWMGAKPNASKGNTPADQWDAKRFVENNPEYGPFRPEALKDFRAKAARAKKAVLDKMQQMADAKWKESK